MAGSDRSAATTPQSDCCDGAGSRRSRKQRTVQVQQPRNWRSCAGELIQVNESGPHGPKNVGRLARSTCSPDDATSPLIQQRFISTESAFSYFGGMRITGSHRRMHQNACPPASPHLRASVDQAWLALAASDHPSAVCHAPASRVCPKPPASIDMHDIA